MTDVQVPASILEASQRIGRGELRPSELVEACLRQIDAREAEIQAWVLVDRAAARAVAAQADEDVAAGRVKGPLHGIPLGIKDIVDVAGLPTKAGSRIRESHVAEEDATVVAKLRAAGAIILGKTVTTEFACFDPPPTKNPWNTERTPGGSSSGSAAALATGMCLGAIGSQTGGSITRPASFCGVTGCKPTFGLVSRAGVVPISHRLDHVGPMARCAADLGILLEVIAGPDPRDSAALDHPPLHYAGSLLEQPPRLGLVTPFFLEQSQPQMRDVFLTAVEKLRTSGAVVVEELLPSGFEHVHIMHKRIMAVEAAEYHQPMYGAHKESYGPNLSALIEEGLATSPEDYHTAIEHQDRFKQNVRQLFHGVDAILVPATVTTAPTSETTGDPRFNSPWSYGGVPTVNIPCGVAEDGLPVGMQFVGGEFSEPALLRIAEWAERALK